jgi:hypothetical protein
VLRVLRIVKLFLFNGYATTLMKNVSETLKSSRDALTLLFVISLVSAVFFGSVIFLIERGEFEVDLQHQSGYFRTVASNGVDTQESLFGSVLTGIYYTFTTLTTGQSVLSTRPVYLSATRCLCDSRLVSHL